MYRAICVILAGMGVLPLTAQTEPTDQTMRDLMKNLGQYGQVTVQPGLFFRQAWPVESKLCAIPLRQIPIPKNLEPMPVMRPRTDLFDNMPVAKTMPPCEEQTH